MATMAAVDISDLRQFEGALARAYDFLKLRDEMNAAVHLDAVRYSPLTREVGKAVNQARLVIRRIEQACGESQPSLSAVVSAERSEAHQI